tara:strand:+ start:417 stop:1061 length:645 start_codon:yes stop_codon:yes gene_type:complete
MNDIGKQLYQIVPKNMAFDCSKIVDPSIDPQKTKDTRNNYIVRESLVARECAIKALGKLGTHVKVIMTAPEGNPIWPKGFTGSLSHSKGQCMAIVGRKHDYRTIGVDLELTGRIKPATIARITHDSEKASIGVDRCKGTILFSLKEAFYKAQFPLYEIPIGFKDVAFKIDETKKTASIIWVSRKLLLKQCDYREWAFVYKTIGEYTAVICWLKN